MNKASSVFLYKLRFTEEKQYIYMADWFTVERIDAQTFARPRIYFPGLFRYLFHSIMQPQSAHITVSLILSDSALSCYTIATGDSIREMSAAFPACAGTARHDNAKGKGGERFV